jgi:hypothetical protein
VPPELTLAKVTLFDGERHSEQQLGNGVDPKISSSFDSHSFYALFRMGSG